MSYPIDLINLPILAHARRDDFEVMRYQLIANDDLSDAVLDAIVERLAIPIIAGIDCKQCGNCCASLDVYLTPQDAQRLADGVHVPLSDLLEAHINTAEAQAEGEWGKFAQRPCAFLCDRQCTVYAHRPQTCRDYPFLTPDFRWMLSDLIDGASLCPIIYYTLCAVWDYVEHELYNT